jgi:hypothetical protein
MKPFTSKSFQIVLTFMFLGICTCHSYASGLVTQQLTDNDSNDVYPQVSGPYAVWEWEDPNEGDSEIMFYDSENIIRLTDNAGDDINPEILGREVVWQGLDSNDGDWEIFYYDGHSVQQLTNDTFDDTNPKISDSLIIWESWDGNDWEIDTARVPVPASMKVTPQSLNLKSKGWWITVHLTLPEGMTSAQLDNTSLLLMGEIPPDKVWKGKWNRWLDLKFKRDAVQALLTPGPEVEIYLTGQMKDGTAFEASDTIKVISPGH